MKMKTTGTDARASRTRVESAMFLVNRSFFVFLIFFAVFASVPKLKRRELVAAGQVSFSHP